MILSLVFCIVFVATNNGRLSEAYSQINKNPFLSADINGLDAAEKASFHDTKDYKSENLNANLKENYMLNRRKRVVVQAIRGIKIGFGIVNDLLKNAKSVPSQNEFRRNYVKSGGMEQMKRDFDDIIFNDVRNYNGKSGASGKVGRIGDRVIITNIKGTEGNPTIEILRVKDKYEQKRSGRQFEAVRDVITYVD